ncbi:YoaK family protein [Mucilaginibacter sp. AW1-3]
MLYHTGQKRTFKHNIRLAALLCLTAGFVNVAGFIGFGVLTTNITGHVALFADNLSQTNFALAWRVGFWMLMFFSGAFVSSLWLKFSGHNKRFAYTTPILFEMTILLSVGYWGNQSHQVSYGAPLLAGSLLFAMGLQNALVSMISGAVVRTTHLTGIFTDLAIDLSALFGSERLVRSNLKRKILLKFVIISFFFLGGILGGFLFRQLRYHTFFIPAGILFIIMIYDAVRLRTRKMIIRLRHN